MIKAALALMATTVVLAGCNNGYNSPTNSAAVRTVGGAAVGALAADALGGSGTKGALVGALAGGLSCVQGGCN